MTSWPCRQHAAWPGICADFPYENVREGVSLMNMINFILGILAFVLSVFSIILAIFLYYRAIARNNLIEEIKDVLGKCRECNSWDDRSELKLFQYIGAVENRLGR
jgi:hypothetical protein